MGHVKLQPHNAKTQCTVKDPSCRACGRLCKYAMTVGHLIDPASDFPRSQVLQCTRAPRMPGCLDTDIAGMLERDAHGNIDCMAFMAAGSIERCVAWTGIIARGYSDWPLAACLASCCMEKIECVLCEERRVSLSITKRDICHRNACEEHADDSCSRCELKHVCKDCLIRHGDCTGHG